jgi:hypothetical protein
MKTNHWQVGEGEAEGRGEQKRWREGRKEVMEQRQEGLRKFSSQRRNICKHSHDGKPWAKA